MADDNKIISFEEYRRKLRGADYEESPLSEMFNQDLREQEDLVAWYSFHQTFNRLQLFVHCLFQQNELQDNPNSGFVMAFDLKQMDRAMKQLEDAVRWTGRVPLILDARDRTFCQLADVMTNHIHRTRQDAYNGFRRMLLETDKVIVIRELSASKLGADKPGKARSLIKILDDAHFDGVTPRASLIFLDYAAFLQKAWRKIGIYLNVVTA